MDAITLNNNLKIPKLGFGVFQTPEGKQTEDAVKWALEAGYRHIDTAMIYGNEGSVGKAMEESGIPRKDIFLTTKLWNENIRQSNTAQAFEDSLNRLRTDYLDLYLIHWPADGFEKAWIEMEKIYASGRAKAIGVSNFQPRHLEAIGKVRPLPGCEPNRIKSIFPQSGCDRLLQGPRDHRYGVEPPWRNRRKHSRGCSPAGTL